jgi:hypothetical protein
MKPFFAIFLSLLICSAAFPQENSSNPKYALSFGIADNFRLDKFALDIAVKKIINETSQLRLFLSPRITITNNDTEYTENKQTQEQKIINYSIGAGADYLWTLLSNEDVNMFGGAGVIITYGKNTHEGTTYFSNGTKSAYEQDNPFISSGLRGTIGVEWKVNEKIGIHSEYLFTAVYLWSKSENKNILNDIETQKSTSKVTGFNLASGVLFGVSIYL